MNTKCDCGGTLQPALLKDFDATEDLGLPVLVKQVRGLRCAKCGWETIDGKAFKEIATQAAALLLALPQRLSREQTIYLRKYLDLTQRELAARMGITRKTVSEWEMKGGRISPQNDLILRTLVFAHISASEPAPAGLRELAQAISHVRTAAPRAKLPPLSLAPKTEAA
jgi:DNA-binding transcriptional regulator YiaG